MKLFILGLVIIMLSLLALPYEKTIVFIGLFIGGGFQLVAFVQMWIELTRARDTQVIDRILEAKRKQKQTR